MYGRRDSNIYGQRHRQLVARNWKIKRRGTGVRFYRHKCLSRYPGRSCRRLVVNNVEQVCVNQSYLNYKRYTRCKRCPAKSTHFYTYVLDREHVDPMIEFRTITTNRRLRRRKTCNSHFFLFLYAFI